MVRRVGCLHMVCTYLFVARAAWHGGLTPVALLSTGADPPSDEQWLDCGKGETVEFAIDEAPAYLRFGNTFLVIDLRIRMPASARVCVCVCQHAPPLFPFFLRVVRLS